MRATRGMVVGGGAAVAAAAALAAGMAAVPSLVARQATAALREAGFAEGEVVIDTVGLTQARGGVKLGGDQGIDEFVLSYSPLGALARRFEALSLAGVRLRVRLGPDGAAIEGRATPVDSAEPATPVVIDDIAVQRSRLTLLTPAGELSVPVSGRLVPQPGGAVEVAADIGGEAPATPGAGTVSGQARLLWQEGRLPTGQADLRAEGIHLSATEAIDLRLAFQADAASLRLDGEAALGGAARLTVAARHGGGGPAPALALTAELQAGDLAPVARLAGLDLRGRGTLKLTGEGAWGQDGLPPPLRLQLDAAGLAGPGGLKDAKLTADVTGRLGLLPGSASGPLDAGLAGTVAGTVPGYAAAARFESLRVTREAAGAPLRLAFAAPEIRVEMPAQAVQLRSVTATLDHGADGQLAASLSGALSGRDPKSWVPALQLRADAQGLAGGAVSFAARGTGAGGDLVVDAKGGHDLATGRGDVRLRLKPVVLAPGGRKPEDFVPALADLVDTAQGTVGLKGSLAWGPGAGGGSGELLLKGVSLTGPSFSVAELNTVLTASSLRPLVLPEGQMVGIGLANLGIPLTDGLVGFALAADGRLHLSQARFSWAGGSVEAEPFVGGLQRWDRPLVLRAQGLDLGQVLALATVEGLSATGTLGGRIPLTLAAGKLSFDKGALAAAGPGQIRYDPSKPPSFLSQDEGSSTALVMKALSNFHYTDLAVGIDGLVGEEMKVTLRVKGANPDFYGGYPVSLNLNLSGALMSVLRQGLDAYRLPDALRERLEQYGQEP